MLYAPPTQGIHNVLGYSECGNCYIIFTCIYIQSYDIHTFYQLCVSTFTLEEHGRFTVNSLWQCPDESPLDFVRQSEHFPGSMSLSVMYIPVTFSGSSRSHTPGSLHL